MVLPQFVLLRCIGSTSERVIQRQRIVAVHFLEDICPVILEGTGVTACKVRLGKAKRRALKSRSKIHDRRAI